LHELAHGLAARALGDSTAERMGRLTLNPLKHLDMFGSVILPVMTYLIGGFMFGYAKPVPYNPDNLRDKKYGSAKVALAGPAANILLAVMFGLVIRIFGAFLPQLTVELLGFIVLINIVLALFNLIPVPPLDGHWVLFALLPRSSYSLKMSMYRSQWLLLIGAILFIFPLLMPLVNLLGSLLTGWQLF
jgi:Zn-dependent protease